MTRVKSPASCLPKSQYAIRNQYRCGDGQSKGSDRNSTAESPDPGVKHSLRVADNTPGIVANPLWPVCLLSLLSLQVAWLN